MERSNAEPVDGWPCVFVANGGNQHVLLFRDIEKAKALFLIQPFAQKLQAEVIKDVLQQAFVPDCARQLSDGERHPSDRFHTDRLIRLQQAIHKAVVRSLGGSADVPIMRTEISKEKADSLGTLHTLCDWVITVDLNAGFRYGGIEPGEA